MSEVKNTQDEHHHQSKMVRGVAWLTAGNFISRLLGIIYIIPWLRWLEPHNAEANALFNMGYNTYALFLLISTVGIPVAVAKQIAKYNTLKQEDTSYYLVREFLKVMLVLGLVFAGIMYFAAPLLARWSGAETDLLPVMRSLSWAILFFPIMSVMRGVFQGENNLRPYAVSQVAEQILRIIWILTATFYIMKLGSGDYKAAVVQSTFAAFIGMVASLVVLTYSLYQSGSLKKILTAKPLVEKSQTYDLILETTKEAIPFIVIGSAIQLYQYFDQLTFVNTMSFFTDKSRESLLVLYTYMIANPSKITMLLIAVSISIGSVSIPLITENFVKKERRPIASLILDNLQLLFLVLFPAILGSIILAGPLYYFFYKDMTTAVSLNLFVVNLLQVLVIALYALFGATIQALFENRRAMIYFAYGLMVKVILQIPLIWIFQSYGPLLSTSLGLGVSTYLMYKHVHGLIRFNRKIVFKNTLLISLMAATMAVIVGLVELVLVKFFPITNAFSSLLHLMIGGGLGVGIYGYMTLWTGLADKLIGAARAQNLRRKLKISGRR